ncbi:MAG: hypothetical protein Q8N10_17660 [Phenylobacterium sp.]|uniref:hypothetical protein n=1 Tax=Phenylobacterium sp. TaxID=1871053 RepID=UPI002722DA4D|nr:hypothetical protein [Phenylobacterium sp.]MDO8322329.1 hypothetical protein [Phenylobacterium sp.]MDO8910605.1 hypothetical protein [Phenylobacterium sp.]MDP3102318.1 hypothetical protein [Phenylobacterium sp.]HQT52480.1 hypothetical protein [Phenylobacterium sp.]
MPAEKPPKPHQDATITGEPELLDDGQEEAFSYTAIERGLVKDPLAMDPDLLRPADTTDRPRREAGTDRPVIPPHSPTRPIQDA